MERLAGEHYNSRDYDSPAYSVTLLITNSISPVGTTIATAVQAHTNEPM